MWIIIQYKAQIPNNNDASGIQKSSSLHHIRLHIYSPDSQLEVPLSKCWFRLLLISTQVFGVQRLFIIAFFYIFTHHRVKSSMIPKILPYSFFMCLSNILSSYCITIMPLAGFLSFKKFIVVFILALSVFLKLPAKTNSFQNYCIIGIVVGGAMVGEKDLLHGNMIGYVSCLLFNLSQAIVLQYSAYLYRHDHLQPEQLLLYNCVIGLPYYLGVLTYEAEFDDIYFFFRDKFSFALIFSLGMSIILACISQLSSSYIAMKISPFQKSTVANIKDLILMVFSVIYFLDLTINLVSGLGIAVCLTSSVLFSLPYLQQPDIPQKLSIPDSQSSHQLQQTTSLYDQNNSPKTLEHGRRQPSNELGKDAQNSLIIVNLDQHIYQQTEETNLNKP